MDKKFEADSSDASTPKDDCDCGCAGHGDCAETAEVVLDRGRRKLMVGGTTVAVVATLANRRAFACDQVCGPISRAGSLTPSKSEPGRSCGGMRVQDWRCYGKAVQYALGNKDPAKTTLGSVLTGLSTVDSSSARTTFKTALCGNSNASHWACAILNAATSTTWNPAYGYNVGSLNTAILAAYNKGKGAPASTILDTIQGLENGYMTVSPQWPYNSNNPLCGGNND